MVSLSMRLQCWCHGRRVDANGSRRTLKRPGESGDSGLLSAGLGQMVVLTVVGVF